MEETRRLRLAPSLALKARRLEELAAGRGRAERERVVEDALVAGSLELAGATAPDEAERLRRALAIRPAAVFSVQALAEWHEAVTGSSEGLRRSSRPREAGPPTCPPEFIQARLEGLEAWLASESAMELSAGQRGALVLARLVEIAPFADGNGRVARLAAAHAMAYGGGHAPILAGADRERLVACLQAAFQLSTEPLVMLLEEASERALDLAIRALETGA